MNTWHARLKKSAVSCLLVLNCASALADTHTGTASALMPKAPVSAASSLDFALTLDRFVSLSVGTSSAPVSFNLASVAAGQCGDSALRLCVGNGTPVAATANGVLPITVRSNAGAVKLMASVKTPLTSEQGAETIPMSQIKISSSDNTNLPAPPIPDSGSGISVNVIPTDFGGRVTQRSAQWTFAFANTVSASAGVYHGKIVFTATLP